MLLEFGMKNWFSFRDDVVVSFKLDDNCPSDIQKKRTFTPILGIKGANGAGKTHVLKGITFLRYFCTDSFSDKPDHDIAISPFYDSSEFTEMFAEFQIGKISYRYELVLSEKAVERETIYRTNAKRTKILERTRDEIKYATKKLDSLKGIKLRKNASIISIAHQHEIDALEEVYSFFNSINSNVNYAGLEERKISLSKISDYYFKNPDVLKFATQFIIECDIGIVDIKILEQEGDEKEKKYRPVFLHLVDEKKYAVTEYTESSGTKALFRALLDYKAILDSGGTLVIDEFDMNLHPHILPKLINLFDDPSSNPLNANFIFTTHDSEVINLLGRYRTFLVNKVDNESFGYRLDELPSHLLRNDRPLLPAYNDGKIGGVPKI